MDIGRCMNDAVDVYKKNWLVLVLAAIIVDVLIVVTLLILAGPLSGGFSKMVLNAMRRADKTVNLGDLFGSFHRFCGLLGLFFLCLIAVFVGLALLVIPGIALMTIWLFPFYLIVDKDMRVFQSLGVSQNIVTRKGLGANLLLVIITLVLILPSFIPYLGIMLAWFLTPITWLMCASAYVQQVDEDDGTLADLFPEHAVPSRAVPETAAADQWSPIS